MGAQGKTTKDAIIDNIPIKNDKFKRVKAYKDITPYQLERMNIGEYIESSRISGYEEEDITHGESNVIVGYKITKNKGNSYTIRFRQGRAGTYTSSVKVSKSGLESYLKRMKRAASISFHYDDIVKVINK